MPPPSSPVDVQYSCQEDTNQQQSTTLIDFFTACGDPAIIISLDDYRIEHANDAFLRDISPGILHEKRSFVQNFVHADDVQAVTLLLATFRKPPAQTAELTSYVTSHFASAPPTQKPVRSRFQTLILSDGMPKYFTYEWTISQHPISRNLVLVGRNISEDNVRDISRAAEFEDFFENAPIALHWLSGEGVVLWANKTELDFLGYTKEEYFGRSIMDFCPDEAVVLEIFKQLGSGNTIHDVPVRMRHKDGTIKNILVDSNVNYHPDGTFHHTRCFIRDDTARKLQEERLKAQLEAAEATVKAKDDFLHSLAHDIRTPMHALLGTVQLLSMTPLTPDQEAYSETILHSGQELCNMLDNIMDTIKVGNDGSHIIHLKNEPFDLKAEIEGVIKRLAVLIGDKEVLLSLAWHSGIASRVPRWVRGDVGSFKRVLMNLISNSIRFTEKGFITVSVKYDKADPAGQPFKISVVDTGCGIATEDVQHVFRKYWKKELEPGKGNTEVHGVLGTGGTGLGLNICQMLVKAMGGAIGVESQSSASSGATFWFKLPFEAVPDREIPRTLSHSGSSAGSHSVYAQSVQREVAFHPPPQITSKVRDWMDRSANDVSSFADVAPSEAKFAPALEYVPNPQAGQPYDVRLPGQPYDTMAQGMNRMDLGLDLDRGRAQGAIEAIMRQSQMAIETILKSGMNQVGTDPASAHIGSRQNSGYFTSQPAQSSEHACDGGDGKIYAGYQPMNKQPQHQPPQHTQQKMARSSASLYATQQQGYDGTRQNSQYISRGTISPATTHSKLSSTHSRDNLSPPPYPTPSSQGYPSPMNSPNYFPLPGPEPSLIHSHSPPSVASDDSSTYLGLKVLVAEDNPLCSKLLAQILTKLSCTVTTSINGVDCLHKYTLNKNSGQGEFDVVLMDVRMPNMDGITAAKGLRDRGFGGPIVAVTAERGEEEKRMCFKVGMNAFLSKPIMVRDLVGKVRSLCGDD